jgi:hypothetical protein
MPRSKLAEAHTTRRSNIFIWYCSECGDGPLGDWFEQCTSCDHIRCSYCKAEAMYDLDYLTRNQELSSSADMERVARLITDEGDTVSLNEQNPQNQNRQEGEEGFSDSTTGLSPAHDIGARERFKKRENGPLSDNDLEAWNQRPHAHDLGKVTYERGRTSEGTLTLLEEAMHQNLVDTAQFPIGARLQRGYSDDNDDTASMHSGYAASIRSIFSQGSFASSTTGFSGNSGFSEIEVATASKELTAIFHEDQVMQPLYKNALENPTIGPDRLQRNLRRLFKVYAENLKDEAADQLEYLAARFVSIKAREIAASIVAKYQCKSAQPQSVDREQDGNSSDEEADAGSVNEEAFANLVILRTFLAGSVAFELLRTQLQSFVLPTLPLPSTFDHIQYAEKRYEKHERESWYTRPTTEKMSKVRTWHSWWSEVVQYADAYLRTPDRLPIATIPLYLLTDFIFLITDGLLRATGLLEPPQCLSKVRLRWSCVRNWLSSMLPLRPSY